jgi:DNA polymerase III epsilon subunit family exonuclease
MLDAANLAIGGVMSVYVSLDLETTGLSPETDRIIEIGAVRFDETGQEFGRFETLVSPGRPISPTARAIHRITDAELADAPPADLALPALADWLGDPAEVLLMAHHARFDASFLGAGFSRLGRPIPGLRFADTLSLARFRLPRAGSHKLDTLAELLHLGPEGPSHRALIDCLRVKALWLALEGPTGRYLTYPVFDPALAEPLPGGMEALAEAMTRGRHVRMTYSGGSYGTAPRDITPVRVFHGGGVAYLVAFCHLDGQEKRFRLDRVLTYEVLEAAQVAIGPPARAGGRRGRRA